MVTIGKNLIRNEDRRPSNKLRLIPLDEFADAEISNFAEPIEDADEEHEAIRKPDVRKIEAAMARMAEVDREILLLCLDYGAIGDNPGRIPQKEKAPLLAKYGLTDASFRQHKKRALDSIRKDFPDAA